MKVVHLAMTPLAGAPIRMVRALNRFTPIQARLVNANPAAYGTRTFDEDVDLRDTREEAQSLIADADILHCHHWMDLRSNPFGMDMRGKRVLRHFHSEPAFVAKHARVSVETVVNDPLPQLVVAQFHERYYPNARPIPNLLDLQALRNAEAIAAQHRLCEDAISIAFSPTSASSAFDDRWNTKGAPETLKMLQRLAPHLGLRIDVFSDLPHQEAMARKAVADMVIDEMVTGSYHLSGLEALALGKTTFGHLDARTVAILTELTGSVSLPWINVHLHGLPQCLEIFSVNPEVRQALGESSRHWVETHWKSEILVQHLVKAYEDLLEGRPMVVEPRVNPITDIAMQDYNWRLSMQQLENRLKEF